MIGVLYNEVNKYREWLPTYPTAWQRFIVGIKNLFAREEETVVVDREIDMLALVGVGVPAVYNALNILDHIEPTISRRTDKEQGWFVEVTKKENFLKVANNHTVHYYHLTIDPLSMYDNTFYNVERIISVAGERDDIHKKTRRKTSSAEAA